MSYANTATTVGNFHRFKVGLLIQVENFKRQPEPKFCDYTWLWQDGGYCIDAPDLMPAGGCYAELVNDPTDNTAVEYFPCQLTIVR